MKKYGKKLVSMCLALVMLIAMVPVVNVTNVQAATKKLTMYVGEAFEGHLYGYTITSVKSSNKKVVKAAKASDRTYAYTMTAKKAGSATLTVKYKSGSKKYTNTVKVTVKKADIKITAQTLDGGYVLFKIKNNTSQSFEKIAFTYTIKDTSGSTIASSTETANYIVSKDTAYDTVYVGRDLDIDASASTFKLTGLTHDPDYTYKKAGADDVVATVKDEEASSSSISFKITTKNKLSKSINGYNYVLSYDADGNIIALDKYSLYMSSKETKTASAYVSVSEYTHPNYDHYEVVTKAYSYAKKK
jgi:hypothetical protein